MKKTYLCNISDIENPGAKNFEILVKETQVEFFIVQKNNKVFAYKNSCPHTRANLNWNQDQFLDASNTLIQCSLHFAQFEIETGFCIYGPCKNQHLTKIDILVEDGEIFLLL